MCALGVAPAPTLRCVPTCSRSLPRRCWATGCLSSTAPPRYAHTCTTKHACGPLRSTLGLCHRASGRGTAHRCTHMTDACTPRPGGTTGGGRTTPLPTSLGHLRRSRSCCTTASHRGGCSEAALARGVAVAITWYQGGVALLCDSAFFARMLTSERAMQGVLKSLGYVLSARNFLRWSRTKIAPERPDAAAIGIVQRSYRWFIFNILR